MQGDDHAVDVLDFAELSFWTLEPGREEANMEGRPIQAKEKVNISGQIEKRSVN